VFLRALSLEMLPLLGLEQGVLLRLVVRLRNMKLMASELLGGLSHPFLLEVLPCLLQHALRRCLLMMSYR
jgi:hypothetical protein